ncbi:MAG: hypothetical protein UT32_C0028G0002 [Parcubacteria group bacterium GW2011_GWC2_39_14]|nr:MAG: hypothetical protein UT32_C0028G0002 [Parcubacteria group bacterium GW2011_GWC2_39_14]KKR53498.1 MAG: hypothetical protein UT91_C0026G0002 [Parcubacteria group bacterium GW2011_GWA2_40_23]
MTAQKKSKKSKSNESPRASRDLHVSKIKNKARVAKIFITHKDIPQAPQSIPEKTSSHLTFGLLQHEIDELLTQHHSLLSDAGQANKQIEASITKELSALLPKQEKVEIKKDFRRPTHTDIVIKDVSEHRAHSPYVLDLSDLIDKKHLADKKKHLVSEFLFHRDSKQPLPLEPQKTQPNLTPIVSDHEEIIILAQEKPQTEEDLAEQFTQAPWYYNFGLPINWHRKIVIYIALCVLVVLPIKVFGYYSELKQTKDDVMNYAQSAYEDLKLASKAISSNELDTAEQNLNSAQANFDQAEQKVAGIDSEIQTILKVIPTNSANLADAEYLLRIGKLVSTVGKDLIGITSGLKENDGQKLTAKISTIQSKAEVLLPQLQEINSNLNKIRLEAIPEDKQETFKQIKSYFNLALSDLEELSSLATTLNEVLGADHFQRYLVVFQNNNEIRPTGGFMGSFALLDIDRGAIKNMEIPGGGIYALQGQLLENKISPYPLQLIQSRWEMQDANWFPDFATSAEKVRWFYKKSGGPTTDGVIAINASLVPKLLEIVGPIAAPKYGKLLTAENFITETQNTVEFEYDKTENKPKQILADIAPTLLEKMFDLKGEDLVKLINVFKDGLSEKDIQLYFHNEAVEKKFASYNWTGAIKDTSRDYLSIVNANIRGYKTDAVIEQNYELNSVINDNGEIVNTLKIIRKHNGNANDPLTGKSNVDFVRIYTPEGSQLLTASGFSDIPETSFEPVQDSWTKDEDLLKIQGSVWIEPNSKTQINNEFGKTVFGNWIQTDPGETSEVTVTYKLPFRFKFNESSGLLNIFSKKTNSTYHSLYLQKQSGTQNTSYQVAIHLPNNKKVSWTYPENLDVDTDTLNYKTNLAKDNLIAFVVE